MQSAFDDDSIRDNRTNLDLEKESSLITNLEKCHIKVIFETF